MVAGRRRMIVAGEEQDVWRSWTARLAACAPLGAVAAPELPRYSRAAIEQPLEEVTMAADPVQVASNVYTTLFENDRVRLLEARLAPGDSSVMHGHPDYVVYNLADGKVRFSSPSGETEEVDLPAGATMWRDAEEHSAENVGTSELRSLLFELK
jgi:quercetin dioxygenase-like cupin family protein